jgi:hypothetical protein
MELDFVGLESVVNSAVVRFLKLGMEEIAAFSSVNCIV